MRPNHPPDLQRFDILRWPLDGGAVCRGAPGASQPDLHIAQSDHRTSPVLAAGCHVSRKRSISGRYLSKYRRTTAAAASETRGRSSAPRSEEHTSELQSRLHLVCRLLLEKKKKKKKKDK